MQSLFQTFPHITNTLLVIQDYYIRQLTLYIKISYFLYNIILFLRNERLQCQKTYKNYVNNIN